MFKKFKGMQKTSQMDKRKWWRLVNCQPLVTTLQRSTSEWVKTGRFTRGGRWCDQCKGDSLILTRITSQTSFVPTSVIVFVLQQKYWGGRGVGKFGEGEHKGREKEWGRKGKLLPTAKPGTKASSSQQPSSETGAGGGEQGSITLVGLILASNLELLLKTCPSSSHQRLHWIGESQN